MRWDWGREPAYTSCRQKSYGQYGCLPLHTKVSGRFGNHEYQAKWPFCQCRNASAVHGFLDCIGKSAWRVEAFRFHNYVVQGFSWPFHEEEHARSWPDISWSSAVYILWIHQQYCLLWVYKGHQHDSLHSSEIQKYLGLLPAWDNHSNRHHIECFFPHAKDRTGHHR